jgi:predicted phage terminase large subunit-like protein
LLTLLLERKRRNVGRASLTEFAREAGYEPAPHHRLLIRCLEALERGDSETLIVEMPPGSAKSTFVNYLFPAWFLARNPERNVLTASHSSELAERWGRKTRNLIQAERSTLGLDLSGDSTAAYRWATARGGEYYAVGVGVGIAGFRADLGIIDDPFGSREDAASKRIKDSRWDWFSDDFSPRLKPGARRVIMHTRWADDDLAGRVKQQLSGLGRPFECLTLPAEAEPGDPLGRKPGEMLWDEPEGYNYGSFLRARKQESDTRTWASLYQQKPVPDTGGYFKADWLHALSSIPPRGEMRIYGASDYAVTEDGGDYTVHLVVGIDRAARLYVLDLWRGQTDSAAWIEAWCDLVRKWRPTEWAEESGQIRAAVGPYLKRRATERQAFVFRRQFPSRHDKAVRAQSIRARMSMQSLYLPASAAWRADFESELLRFPAGVHDDQVDALSLVGQLLDHISAPVVEVKTKKPYPAPRDWFTEPETDDDAPDWKVA